MVRYSIRSLPPGAPPAAAKRARARSAPHHTAFTGRLGGDPEKRYTPAGTPLLNFSVCVDETTTATTERAAPEPTWVRCTVWEERAEELADTLRKGSLVYVEGRLRHNTWETREGDPRCGLSVSAWRVDVQGGIGKRAPQRSALGASA